MLNHTLAAVNGTTVAQQGIGGKNAEPRNQIRLERKDISIQ
jgi:hypothetical protein